jgi:hypothetical protein
VFPPPLFSERPASLQIALGLVLPVAFGALTGYALAHSKGLYIVLNLLALIGGIGGGFDHPSAAEGARRGAVGGTLFGLAIVIVHAIEDRAVQSIPHPAILLVILTALAGIALGAIGGFLRGRYAEPAPS